MPCGGCHFIEDTIGICCHGDKTLHQLLCKFWRPGEGSGIQQRVDLWYTTFNWGQINHLLGNYSWGRGVRFLGRCRSNPGGFCKHLEGREWNSWRFLLWKCAGHGRWWERAVLSVSGTAGLLQIFHSNASFFREPTDSLFHDPREETEVLNQCAFLSSEKSILSRELFSETLGGTWGGCILGWTVLGTHSESTSLSFLCCLSLFSYHHLPLFFSPTSLVFLTLFLLSVLLLPSSSSFSSLLSLSLSLCQPPPIKVLWHCVVRRPAFTDDGGQTEIRGVLTISAFTTSGTRAGQNIFSYEIRVRDRK